MSAGNLTITNGEISATASNGYGIYAIGSSKIEIQGNSTITSPSYRGVYRGGTGSLTMDGGKITGNAMGVYIASSSSLTMNSGNISATASNGYGIYATSSGAIEVKGGTITNPYMGVRLHGTGNFTMTDGTITGTGVNGTGLYSTNSSTIAIKGGTITSPNSNGWGVGTSAESTSAITMDGGEIIAERKGVYLAGGNFTMTGGTIYANGSIPESNTSDKPVALQIYKTATLNGGTIKSTGDGVYPVSGGTFNLNGGAINAKTIGIVNYGENKANKATTINITDGEVNSEGIGIYHPGVGYLNISGGTINGVDGGIHIRNGKLNISGGTIHATGPKQAYDYHNSGSTSTGDALIIERTNYGEHITGNETYPDGETYTGTQVNISYGIFISDHADAVHSYIKSDDLSQTDDGVERCLYFLTNGWYSNKAIPEDHCAPPVKPDPTAHELNAPDMRAQYTIYTPLSWIEMQKKDNVYTISDQLLAVYAIGHSLWCKDVGKVSNAKTAPTSATQPDYMRTLLTQAYKNDHPGDTEWEAPEWDQSNWIELQFGDEISNDTLKKYENKYIKEATVFGTLTDKLNYRLKVDYSHATNGDRPLMFVKEDATYDPNTYCAANFLEKNLILNDDDKGALASTGDYYYFLNPKVQEYTVISYVMWVGTENDEKFVVPEKDTKERTNGYDFDGSFKVDMKYNIYGDVRPKLTERLKAGYNDVYTFHAIIERTEGSTYGPAYADEGSSNAPAHAPTAKPNQTPSPNIVVCPIDLNVDLNIITGVNDLNATKMPVSVKYVDVAGHVSDRPFNGVNIVVTTFSDGSHITTKQVR